MGAGFQVKYQNMPFAGMIPALQTQTVDAAVAAMTITAERVKIISFSRPYFKSGVAIATRTDNQNITNKGQLIVAENYRSFETYATVALVYLFLTLFFSQAFSRSERSLNPVKKQSG